MKKLFAFTLLCMVFFYCDAQNNDYYDRMNHVFGNIDKTKVTTGYLKEFGIRFNEVEAYNGVISFNNLVDKTQWQSLYSSLYTMRVGSIAASMAAPNTVFDNLKTQQANSTEDVLLTAQYYNYQQYKINALSNGDVTVISDRIYDVAGRNPYDTKTIFGVAPLKNQVEGDTFTFKIPSSLIYSNSGLTISQVQVDFDNGQGYQTMMLNTAKNITYTSGGEKELKVKFVYSGGPTLYSHSKIWVDYIAPLGGAMARFSGNGFLNQNGTLWFNNPVTGNSWNGSTATGRITIELAPGHTHLTKPLIVVEGFDPDNSFNYSSLINRDDPGGLEVEIDNNGLTLNQAIEDEDYDLVFIDYVNGTDYIQRNAYMVEEVIRQVNQLKIGNEKNVVLGMSMGGLVARYALRHMEINSAIHDTKLYISYDTPHQGANVPLGFQALARHLYGEAISIPILFSLIDFHIVSLPGLVPDLNNGYNLLQSPAAQQMLTYQLQGTGANVTVNNNTLYDSFSTEYSSMGYPQQNGIRNIAIANGSECGTPLGFNAYDTLVDVNETIDLPFFTNIALAFINLAGWNPLKSISSLLSTNTDIKVQVNVKALPNQESKQIYKGKIFIKKAVLGFIIINEDLIDEKTVNSLSTMLPLDNANGGVYNIDTFVTLPREFNSYVLEREFNFIPAYSSLDIGGGNQIIGNGDLNKTYTPLSPPVAPKNTPFDNFFTNPIASEQHIQFTLNNGNWLMAELKNNTNAFYTCVSNCVSPDNLELYISGSYEICTSNTETYVLEKVPSGADVNWSVSPANQFTMATSTTSLTLTSLNNYSGNAEITAIITTNCGDNIIVTRTIFVGIPSLNIVKTADYCISKFHYLVFEANSNARTLGLNWTYSPIPDATFLEDGNILTIRMQKNYQSNFFSLFATLTNSCGTGGADYEGSITRCSTSFSRESSYDSSINPNPANSEINVTTTFYKEDSAQKTFNKEIDLDFEIYDVYGYKVYSAKHKNTSVNIATDILKEGFYILIISDGTERINKNFMVKH